MNTSLLFLFLHLFALSNSDPDTHLHLHVPPEQNKGATPNTGRALINPGLSEVPFGQRNTLQGFRAEPLQSLGRDPRRSFGAEPLQSLGREPRQSLGAKPLQRKYVVVGNSEDCAIGTKEITTASECRAAAEDLRLSLGSPFAFLHCHRYCLVYNNMVFFGLNTAKAPSSDSMCAAVCVKEGTTTNSEGFIDASKLWDVNNEWECGISPIGLDDDHGEISGGRVAEPRAFPWIVRMCELNQELGGNIDVSCHCGGTLITSKHVLTAFHCVALHGRDCTKRDFLNGEHFVVLGRNSLTSQELKDPSLYKIPIIDVQHPKLAGLHGGCRPRSTESHDFAMLILMNPVVFSTKVSPICLPKPGARHDGQPVIAAGWGMFTTDNNQDDWTQRYSDLLKRVNLRVSNTAYEHTKMFGTELEFKRGEYQDPCSGDSGGPLMHLTPDSDSRRWVIIGTVFGGGFDCRTGEAFDFEGHVEGTWNMVSAHTEWILGQIQREKEKSGMTSA